MRWNGEWGGSCFIERLALGEEEVGNGEIE